MNMHKTFFIFARTVLGYGICFCVGVVCFFPALILVAILPEHIRYRSHVLFRFLHCTYVGTIRALIPSITITGREHIPQKPAIFVANHQSSLDIPVLGSLMGCHPHTWFVLDRFAHTPILGFFVRRMCLPVDQSCPLQSSRTLIRGMQLIEQEKLHMALFPEGSRYLDGKIHDFFLGFAIIAKKTERPVVPVMIYNLGKIYPPKSFLVYWYPVTVVIGPPFTFEKTETLENFSQRVHRWFEERFHI